MTLETAIKTAKWVGLLVLSVLAWFLWGWMRGWQAPAKDGASVIPPPPKPLQDAVDKAEEEALVARVKAKVEAGVHTQRLEEISKIEDGAKRRQALADLLKTQG